MFDQIFGEKSQKHKFGPNSQNIKILVDHFFVYDILRSFSQNLCRFGQKKLGGDPILQRLHFLIKFHIFKF